MSAGDEQRVRRSVIEANSHSMPLLALHVVSNTDGALEDVPSEITATPTPNSSPQGSEFKRGLENSLCDFNKLIGASQEPSSADCI